MPTHALALCCAPLRWGIPLERWSRGYDYKNDFWAVGMPRQDERPTSRPSSGHPSEYAKAFCDAKAGRRFVQTDLVAIRRDLFTPEMERSVRQLGRVCHQHNARAVKEEHKWSCGGS